MVEGTTYGLAYCDVSTGEFVATEFDGEHATTQLEGELMRLLPAEVLISQESLLPLVQPLQPPPMASATDDPQWTKGHVTVWPSWRWDLATATDQLLRQFNVTTLDGYGLQGQPLATRAAGAVLQYLVETQRGAVPQIERLEVVSQATTMVLDQQTQRNLELLAPLGSRKRGALIDLLDHTQTPMGARLLRRWVAQPLTQLAPIERRQEQVSRYVEDTLQRAELRDVLRNIGDIERLVNRVLQGVARPDDLRRLRDSLRTLPQVAALVDDRLFDDRAFDDLPAAFDVCAEALDLLERAVCEESDDDGDGIERPPLPAIRTGYDAELDAVMTTLTTLHTDLRRWEEHEREQTAIKTLKLVCYKGGWIVTTGKNTPAHLVPVTYHRVPGGTGDDRWTTYDLQEIEARLHRTRARLLELERTALARVIADVAAHKQQLLGAARTLAEIDVFASFAEVAVRRRYVRPKLSEGTELDIVRGRHPVVELGSADFVSNDIALDARKAIMVITGPNMAGKSTYLRQTALIVLLAQIGCYVPADKANIGLVDRIFTRIGAQDDIVGGRSTFMVEMTETANILHSATPRSLVVLDELGRGTSTYDGMSIARAIIESIHESPRLGCRTLFATHYHELTELADSLERVRNYHVAVAEHADHIVFQHKVVPGKSDRSYGIHVARMAGIPRSVLERATEVLAHLEEHASTPQASGRNTLPTTPPAEPERPATPELHPALALLMNVQIDELSPREAMLKLYELQAMLGIHPITG